MKTIDEIKTIAAKLREEFHHTPTAVLPPCWRTASALLDAIDQLREDPPADLETLRVVLDSVLESGGSATPMLLEVAERLGLTTGPTHIFATYEYGWRPQEPDKDAYSGHVTVTGTSLCGRELKYDGNWNAETQDEVNKTFGAHYDLPPDRFCAACASAMREMFSPTPLEALCARLDRLSIKYDAVRLDRDRDYYEAAQDAISAAVPPLEVRVVSH